MSDIALLTWQPMATAPKDGTRILATVRPTEQGPTEVDVVRWNKPRLDDDFCWMATDSSHDCPIVYENWELSHWMPLPSGIPDVKTPGFVAQLPVVPRSDDELDGSGI
ncbi:MAG: hypothetical protein P4L76_14425 [Beijerinckiaceae bacterium]|nr:hypothetical protein [Beijerinckiaceae bacterium]